MRLTQPQTHVDPRETRAPSHNFHAAFTLPELLVVLMIVIILVGMITPPSHGSREKARGIKCVNNLKNVGLALRIYATDNHDRFPWEIPNQKDVIQINYLSDPANYIRGLSNELTIPKIVLCPADTRKEATNWIQFSRTNLSYFISPDASQTFSNSFLAGDRNITNNLGALPPGLNTLSTNDPVGWDKNIHKNAGNACFGDGRVQILSSAKLRDQLRHTGQTNKSIELAVP
jgi:prepilin-type processing-associated H-X9-DG protein